MGGQLRWACVLSPEGACSCHPLPCQSQARVLPAHRAPLSPRQAEAEGPPSQRLGTSLNPLSASTASFPKAARLACSPPVRPLEPVRADPHPLSLLLWECGCHPGLGGLSTSSLSPRIPPPSDTAASAERQTFGLYLRSHVPCAVSRLSHLCPALQLVFKSLGCPLGCPPHSQVPPLVVMSGILQGKATWGKMKGQKINKFPLALG